MNTLHRCDQATDCEDISDEKGCKIVVIDQNNYLKDKPPKEAVLKIKIELLKILEIGEVEEVKMSSPDLNSGLVQI